MRAELHQTDYYSNAAESLFSLRYVMFRRALVFYMHSVSLFVSATVYLLQLQVGLRASHLRSTTLSLSWTLDIAYVYILTSFHESACRSP